MPGWLGTREARHEPAARSARRRPRLRLGQGRHQPLVGATPYFGGPVAAHALVPRADAAPGRRRAVRRALGHRPAPERHADDRLVAVAVLACAARASGRRRGLRARLGGMVPAAVHPLPVRDWRDRLRAFRLPHRLRRLSPACLPIRSPNTSTTCWSSAPAAPACAPPSAWRRRAWPRPASPRCSRHARTPWRRRAAFPPRWATWARTTGATTSSTP